MSHIIIPRIFVAFIRGGIQNNPCKMPICLVPVLLRIFTISLNSVLIYQFYERQGVAPYGTCVPLYLMCFATFAWRIFAMHAGGHRYFAHQSFKCVPWFATLLAVSIAETEVPMLWYWFFLHHEHHVYCDLPPDIHSPVQEGFWEIQFGIAGGFVDAVEKTMKLIGPGTPPNEVMRTRFDADLSWLNFYGAVPIYFASPIVFGLIGHFLGYYPSEFILFGNVLPRFMTVQAASLTNTAAHTFGPRPYTGNKHPPFPNCMASNCWWVALLNGGEGWHNNHHAFCKSARHGFLWYEIDTAWIALRMLAHLGLVWDLIEVTDEVRLTPRTPKVELRFKTKYTTLFTKQKKA